MTPFWIGLLKRAMPVVIEAGSHIYKQRAAANHTPQRQSVHVDSLSERVEALQKAVIRLAEETESLRLKQIQVAHAVTRLQWVVNASLCLALLAIVMVLLKYL